MIRDPIRVLIRAPSPVVRAGLESLLRPYASLRMLEDSEDGRGSDPGEDAVAEPEADVVVAELESQDDLNARELAVEATSGVPVVLLVRGPSTDWSDWLGKGVRAVLPANASGQQIAAAIEAVAAGLVVLSGAEIEGFLPSHAARESLDALPEALTAREIEVLRSMAEGLGNKEIASRLGISEHTVKFHVASIMGKLAAASRTEAVMSGIRHGIVLI